MSVYVVTPSLNKSFKFQSDWPYNNSQVYLINSILEDLKEDEDREFKTKDDGYLYSSTVNYPNNRSLVKQNVYFDKNGQITKTEVVDKDDNVQIRMNFNKQEFNKKFDQNYFELSSLLNMNNPKKETTKKQSEDPKLENSTTTEQNSTINNKDTNTSSSDSIIKEKNTTTEDTKTTTTATIDDIVYPMYLPNNTYLTSQEKIDTENGERLILTFGGDSSFILVEETINTTDEALVIPVSGEFDFLSDVIGVIGTKSLTWHSNGIEYYMTSDAIETAELLEIARSISVLPVSK